MKFFFVCLIRSKFRISWMYIYHFYDLKVNFWWPNKLFFGGSSSLNTLYMFKKVGHLCFIIYFSFHQCHITLSAYDLYWIYNLIFAPRSLFKIKSSYLVKPRGCERHVILMKWKVNHETQMPNLPKHVSTGKLIKFSILLPLKAIYFNTLQYDTPCSRMSGEH